MQDPVKVLQGTAISTNAFTVPVYIHAVTLNGFGTAAMLVGLIAGGTNTVTAEIEVKTSANGHATVPFNTFQRATFKPPVRMGDNVLNTYVNFSGSGTWRVEYTTV